MKGVFYIALYKRLVQCGLQARMLYVLFAFVLRLLCEFCRGFSWFYKVLYNSNTTNYLNRVKTEGAKITEGIEWAVTNCTKIDGRI